MPRVTPFLWFDNESEDAARFYTSIFPNSEITRVSHYTDAGPRPAGSVMLVEFSLDGQKDRFGVSWQVVPNVMLEDLLSGDDRGRAERAMRAMFGMKKLDIAALYAAADGTTAGR